MTRMSRDEVPYTNYSLEECVRRGAEAFDWKARWRPQPGADPGPIKRGAGMTFMLFRSGLGTQQRGHPTLNGAGDYTLFVGVTDVGAGAKTTMGLIAAEALGVPLSQIEVVWGDTDRCPYSVGESGSRTTIMTGAAVVEAARDLKQQIADKGMPTGDQVLTSRRPRPIRGSRARSGHASARTSSKWKSTPSSAACASRSTWPCTTAGRLINPLSAKGQIQGAAIQGIGMALHEDLVYDRRIRSAADRRLLRRAHSDAPRCAGRSRSSSSRATTATGRTARRASAKSGIILAPAAVGNAIFNAIGRRMKDLPITRARILEALRMKGFTNANARDLRHARDARAPGEGGRPPGLVRRRRQRPARPGEGPASSSPT